jgi:hypothetical protein
VCSIASKQCCTLYYCNSTHQPQLLVPPRLSRVLLSLPLALLLLVLPQDGQHQQQAEQQ